MPGPVDPLRRTLPRGRRIRRKAQFDAIHAQGRRLGNELFGVTLCPNEGTGPRLGLAVSIKVAGSGVERNRIRRLIRESFRLQQFELPAVDLVVSARGRARGATNSELRAGLHALWSEVVKRCATWQKP